VESLYVARNDSGIQSLSSQANLRPVANAGYRVMLPPAIDHAIRDIAEDHDSGARQLALKALSALKLSVNEFPHEPSSWPEIVNCAWHISQARPSMKSALYTTILRALHEIKDVYPSPSTNDRLDQIITKEQAILERLATVFTEYIQSNFLQTVSILTLSNSSTIAAALKALFQSPHCPRITLTILESRPLLEGLNLAKSLLQYKPPNATIEIATDAAGAYCASSADVVLIGSDHINPLNGDVKNKIGSVAVARTAKRTLAISSTDKLGEVEMGERVEENDEQEVTGAWRLEGLEGVRVRNVYFEWVSGEDVEGYVTERGVLGKAELKEIHQERLKWEDIWKVLDS
jgi:translation initiation factor 2B subunit (eIF-2B alpha/beta/delta family)